MSSELRPPGEPPAPLTVPQPPVQFVQNAPLGGVTPAQPATEPTSDRRELVLAAALLLFSVIAGASSLLPWRDFGRRFGQAVTETGWTRPDGSLGRGWIAVALGVLLATAGVLIAAEHGRIGRTLAVVTGVGLMALAVGEWAFGSGALRAGPGTGIWVELVVGVVVIVTVGGLSPVPAARAGP